MVTNPISATGCTPRKQLRCAGRRTRRPPTGIVGSPQNPQNRCWSPVSSSRLLSPVLARPADNRCNAIFDLPAYRGKYPEIWVASHGPRMLRATGRYADGWFPVTLFQPGDYAAALEVVRTAASDAGRDPLAIVPASYVFVVTGHSRDEVDEALGSQLIRAFALNLPATEWARHGGRHPFGDDFTGGQDIIPQVLDEETVVAATKDIPDSLLRECFLTGTPDEVVDQAARLRDSGLRYAVLFNMSFAQPNIKRGMTASIPFTRILR